MENSYLFENVSVGSGCTISNAVLASHAVLKENVSCPRGVVLCPGVVISAGMQLKEGQRITSVVGVSAEDQARAMLAVKEAGLARHIGVSEFSPTFCLVFARLSDSRPWYGTWGPTPGPTRTLYLSPLEPL